MKQRLIISSALLHDPTVIIVDEPMVGLDPAAIKMVKDMFRDLAKNGNDHFHVDPYLVRGGGHLRPYRHHS